MLLNSLLQVNIYHDCLKVKVNIDNSEDYNFAYYVLFNDMPIEKTGYVHGNEYAYELDKNGIYSVTAFLKNKYNNEKTIINSDKLRYIRNWNISGGIYQNRRNRTDKYMQPKLQKLLYPNIKISERIY